MNRNYKIWYVMVSIALVISLFVSVNYYNKNQYLEAQLENNYQSAFVSMVENSEALAMLCGKAGIINSGAQSMTLMTQINCNAMNAESAFASLPFEQRYVAEMSNYYNQLGDYAQYCFDTVNRGEKLNDAQITQLDAFAVDMEQVSVRLQELQSVAYNEQMSFINLPDMGQFLEIDAAEMEYSIASVFSDLNSKFSAKEDLNYAGRYSAHLQNIAAKGLNGDKIEQEAAKEKACDFLNKIGREVSSAELIFNGEGADNISMSAYNFIIKADEGDTYISISKQGGMVLDYYFNRTVIEQVISIEDAYSRAEKIINDCGYETMDVMKQYKSGNSSVCFEFAFRDKDEIMYYPDMMLVQIALDNGDLLAFEAHEYYMNHSERMLAEPIVLREVAEAGLHEGLTVEKGSMSLIADGKGEEILCYEFKVSDGEQGYIMHISCEDGSEQQILCRIQDGDDCYTK